MRPASAAPLALGVYPRVEPPNIVHASAAMDSVLTLALRAADTDAKVLITGESGVGKDLVARFIHAHSDRANGPYVALNCAGLAESLLESELFGHVKGSFTDAHRDQAGKLQLADGGTLFLDELGEMSLRMQALLLRFLENGEIQPVGSEQNVTRVNVRVVGATNRNPAELVAAGKFREDLLYRLRVIHIQIPPLRERPEDIWALVEHLAGHDPRAVTFTPGAMRALERYRWPGNIRELQNVVEQCVVLANGQTVDVDDLPDFVRGGTSGVLPLPERRRQVADDLYDALTSGQCSFWEHVYPLFIGRDLTRHDIRSLVRMGLSATHGHYQAVVRMFGMPDSDYKRFMNFLASHDCTVEFRIYRYGTPHVGREGRLVLPAGIRRPPQEDEPPR